MSKFVSQEGVAKRPKRASRACDHCRWKRLKCSDEQKDQSCMNCVIYGVKCLYTPPYSPSSSARKKGESPASTSKAPSNRKLSQVGDRASQSPGLLEKDSPGSAYDDDFTYSSQASGHGMLPKFSNARRLAAEFVKATQATAEIENLAERLDHYAQYLTTYSESSSTTMGLLLEETGLPPQQITNAILQAYTDGFQAGHSSASARWKPSHLTRNDSRRSRSMHEFTPSPTAEHGNSLSPIPMDIASVHHHLASGGNSPHPSSPASQHHHSAHQQQHPQQQQHQVGYGDQSSSSMVGLGINDHDYPLPLQHGHPQAMPSNVRNLITSDPHRQAPRSVPQGLSLSIPGSGQHWTGTGANAGEGSHGHVSGSGMQMPPGYHEHGHQGYY